MSQRMGPLTEEELFFSVRAAFHYPVDKLKCSVKVKETRELLGLPKETDLILPCLRVAEGSAPGEAQRQIRFCLCPETLTI